MFILTFFFDWCQVLKKFGVEKFEPVGQQFDPNSHLALFEVPDPSKEPGTVALVAKVQTIQNTGLFEFQAFSTVRLLYCLFTVSL